MIEGRDRYTRRILAVLACAALFSLLHTVNHDSLVGLDHHDDADAAASMLALVLGVAGGVIGLASVAGWIIAARRRGVLRSPAPPAFDATRPRPALPGARAGPRLPILLSALRR